MSFEQFWTNVRIGARHISPEVVADAPPLDEAAIESALRKETHWLTPESVEGFQESDFPFLSNEERARLTKAVEGFEKATATVRPTVAPSLHELESALPHFREIVKILEFNRYGDAEAYRLGKQIEKKLQPLQLGDIAELRFNTGLDHSGDPALWVWVFLTEEISSKDEDFLKSARRLREIVHPIARRACPDRYPYLSFRPIREPAEVAEAP
jgi:hypothetical protein